MSQLIEEKGHAMTLFEAIEAFAAADDRWQAELVRSYGKAACNARYDGALNRATPHLAKLHDERTEAQRDYHAAWATELQRQRAERIAA